MATIPFAEPPWLNGIPSPYYHESHWEWQKHCRDFISVNLHEHGLEWDKEGLVPEHVFEDFAAGNMLLPNLPAPLPVEWLKKVGIHEMPGGLKVEDWDYMHTAIYVSEMSRGGLAGPPASLTTGFAFGIPPIYKYANRQLQERFLPDFLLGKKRICIAITEPDAGSDVANIQTTAEKSKDGKEYLLNGTKKWITNGIWSDYATMAVRTGRPGAAGLSLLLVPLKGHPGVIMRRLKVQGNQSSGTSFIELDDVRVPASNLIGEEGQGMKYIMTNFNHERLTISIGVTTAARTALSTAMSYTMNRRAFGKPLIDQPVVRHRLAKCGADLESTWSWLESFVYSMINLPKSVADVRMGRLTALAKAKAGLVLRDCAECAVLLFGGNGYTMSGKGELVEAIYRDVMGARIPGGSEDVMLDLAVGQLVKNYERAVEAGKGVVGDKEGMMERPRGSAKI